MGLNAGDALRLLTQHPSIGGAIGMGLLGGSGALAYNAISKPTLDEYGNTIESNDINPFVAALGGAAIGAVGGGIYGHYNQPVARPMQGMRAGASQPPRQSPDIDVDVTSTQQGGGMSTRSGSGVTSQQPSQPGDLSKNNWRNLDDRAFLQNFKNGDPDDEKFWVTPEDAEYINQRISQIKVTNPEWFYSTSSNPNITTVDVTPNRPIVQVVPANPMEIQNPMSRPGMKTVVVRPVTKEPGQEMMEEALRLRELANRQVAQRVAAAKRQMNNDGYRLDSNRYYFDNGENKYNVAGWDLIDPPRRYQEGLELDNYLAQKKMM